MNTPRPSHPSQRTTLVQTAARLLLGAALIFAGAAHLSWARVAFQAQVPPWLPLPADLVVVASGIVEIALGGALIAVSRYQTVVGWIVAGFFVAIFPGNISQYVTRSDAFGLDSDRARAIRLLFQPVLVAWALWATGAWQAWRAGRHRQRTEGTPPASDE
jgi:uncharacterized membrane protein